jgi:hypothetical protein
MANTTLNMTLLLRRAAFADSCILQAGEPGYHTGTKEFKIGDGTTTWANLKVANESQIRTWISDLEATLEGKITANTNKFSNYYTKSEIDNLLSALESSLEALITAEATARENADKALQVNIDAKLATADFTNWKATHETDHANTATAISAEIDADVAAEAALREAADNAINQKIGSKADLSTADTVYGAIAKAKADAIADAESKANAAQSAAESTAEAKDAARAQQAQTALNNAVSALETKITNGDATTLQSAKEYADGKVNAEKSRAEGVEADFEGRISAMEAFFEGAAKDEGEGENLKNALDTLKEIQEFATGEGTAAQEMLNAINQNASDIDAVEADMAQAKSDIIALGSNKVDKTTYEAYINGKSMSDADLKKYAEDEADTAQSAAEAKAAELDSALHTVISKEIDDDVKAAIDAEVTRSNAYADKAESDAITTAASQADAKDAALKTAIEGTSSDASSAKTLAGAKKYAEEKAEVAHSSAVSTAAADAASKANAAQAAAEAAAAADATTKANTAKSEAIAAVVGTADDGAETDTIKGVRKAFESADTTVLNTAKNYADGVAANAVKTNIKSGNDDIVITRPDSGDDAGKTIISHKVYGTGEYTKPDSVNDANFVTGVQIENGHVTGATVKSLAEALSAMTFIFDGGTSAN